jgi:hypothetical protein
MPKRKTKEISQTDRESTKQATKTPAEKLEQNSLKITLTPVQMQQINVLAQIAHNEDPAVYCRKIILQHVADRLYLVRR